MNPGIPARITLIDGNEVVFVEAKSAGPGPDIPHGGGGTRLYPDIDLTGPCLFPETGEKSYGNRHCSISTFH